MRCYVWCLRLDRTCASTAVRTYRSNTDTADAIADLQSIKSRYCASTALHAHHAYNTKRRSRLCGYVANERTSTTYNRSLPSPSAGISLWDPFGLRPHSYWTTVASRIFLCRLRLSVRLATIVGRILVSNVALFLVRRGGLQPISPSCQDLLKRRPSWGTS
jgi:hypothetical protein